MVHWIWSWLINLLMQAWVHYQYRDSFTSVGNKSFILGHVEHDGSEVCWIWCHLAGMSASVIRVRFEFAFSISLCTAWFYWISIEFGSIKKPALVNVWNYRWVPFRLCTSHCQAWVWLIVFSRKSWVDDIFILKTHC